MVEKHCKVKEGDINDIAFYIAELSFYARVKGDSAEMDYNEDDWYSINMGQLFAFMYFELAQTMQEKIS